MSSPRPRSLATGSPSNINPYLSTSPFKNPPALPNIPLRSTPSNPSTPNDSAFAPPAASSSSASVVDGERKIVQPQPQPASNLSASMRQQTPLSLAGLAPSPNHLSPAVQSPADSSSAGDPFSSAFNLEAATEEEKANILRRHLVSAQERRASNAAGAARPDMGNLSRASSFRNDNESAVEGREGPGEEGEEFQLPYNQAGGDVTHDLYKWAQTHGQQSGILRKARSASFSHSIRPAPASTDSTYQQIKEPGGFRRNFIHTKARERGEESPRVVRNVVDFLFLYGHFAGEDLQEEDEEDDDDALPTVASAGRGASENTPLLAGSSATPTRAKFSRSQSRHRKPGGNGIEGTATATDAVFMLLKGFIGTGVLFMGRAFLNGGILFSALVLLFVGAISLWAFLLLVKTRLVVPGSFGDIGGTLYGPWLRTTILSSIALSQIGFVAAYVIFIASNMQDFIKAVTASSKIIDIKYLIVGQLVVFLPLSFIRSIAKLSGTALIADAFILIGLIYIASNEASVLSSKGIADVALFNPTEYPLLIGTAVFAFEGIGLIIPITESMKEPEKFPRVLTWVMAFVSALFAGFGVLSYAAYGSKTATVVIANLPQRPFVQVVQCLYSVAILLSAPLQLFPAVRLMENGIFPRKSGKGNTKIKWQKNLFRTLVCCGCMLLAWAGADDLDKFVSFVGSFCCIPLCFIYPPLLHMRSGPISQTAKNLDILMIVFGFSTSIYTTYQTIVLLFG